MEPGIQQELQKLREEIAHLREDIAAKSGVIMSHATSEENMVATRRSNKTAIQTPPNKRTPKKPSQPPPEEELVDEDEPLPKTTKKSKIYMKKYRDDPEKRKNENMNKILRYIRERSKYKANIETLKKYGIMPEEVTVIRTEKKYEPFDLYITVPDTKAAALKIQSDNIKAQQDLADKIMSNSIAIANLNDTLNDEMPEELKGKLFSIPLVKKFTFAGLKEYMFKKFEGEGHGMRKKSTLEGYYGKVGSNNTGVLHTIIRRHSPDCAKHDTGFRHCFEDMKGLIKSIMEAKIKIGTKFKQLATLSLTMRDYPPLDYKGAFKPQYDLLQQELLKVKPMVDAYKAELKEKQTIDKTFTEMVDLVKEHYGNTSLQYLYMRMFSEFPTRDDFGFLAVKKGKLTGGDGEYYLNGESIPKGINFIVVDDADKKSPVKIVLQEYKTKGVFGTIVDAFSSETSVLIKKLAKKNEYLFGEQKKLSSWVKKLLLGSKIKTPEQFKPDNTVNVGTINLLRHAYVSERLAGKTSEEERVKLAASMKHSPLMSIQYVRKFETKAMKEEAVLDKVEKVDPVEEKFLGLKTRSGRVVKPTAKQAEAVATEPTQKKKGKK